MENLLVNFFSDPGQYLCVADAAVAGECSTGERSRAAKIDNGGPVDTLQRCTRSQGQRLLLLASGYVNMS